MRQSGKYLLDTNIVIGMLTGDKLIQERMEISTDVILSAPVVGKLYYGAQKSDKVSENIIRVNTFVEGHLFFPVI